MTRFMTVTCVGCGKTGRTDAAQVPIGSIPLCPDCEPSAAAILSEFMDNPVLAATSDVIEIPVEVEEEEGP